MNLIDAEGLVQVDTQMQEIENAYISEALFDRPVSGEFAYAVRGLNGYRMTRYMPELEWYLVVQGLNSRSSTKQRALFLLVAFAIIMLVIYVLLARLWLNHSANYDDDDLLEDPVTGLPNRSYLREAYGEAGVFNTTRYKSIAVFDIDDFYTLSEGQDCDAMLRNMVQLANERLAWKGMLLRWGGDNFVALLELSVKDAELLFTEFCKSVEQELGATLSVGIAEVNLSDTIKVNYYRAMEKCYTVKESGGNGVCAE